MSIGEELKASLPWVGASLLVVLAVIVYLVATTGDQNLLARIYGVK